MSKKKNKKKIQDTKFLRHKWNQNKVKIRQKAVINDQQLKESSENK